MGNAKNAGIVYRTRTTGRKRAKEDRNPMSMKIWSKAVQWISTVERICGDTGASLKPRVK